MGNAGDSFALTGEGFVCVTADEIEANGKGASSSRAYPRTKKESTRGSIHSHKKRLKCSCGAPVLSLKSGSLKRARKKRGGLEMTGADAMRGRGGGASEVRH